MGEYSKEARQRAGHLGAIAVHSTGKTNTRDASAAFEARFLNMARAEGYEGEAAERRAKGLRRAHFLRMWNARSNQAKALREEKRLAAMAAREAELAAIEREADESRLRDGQ